ncbi:TPA: thioredoxin domain-containing protein [Providencia rettgeri]|nr:thioredoxin domain-containing protein [Providencia rettgeri]
MAKRKGLKWLLYGVPLAVMVATSGFTVYSLNKQSKLLSDLALVADASAGAISNRGDLELAFDRYIAASGLQVNAQRKTSNAIGVSTGNKPTGSYAPSTDSERIYGNPDAQFYIIEYSDFECPYCKTHFPQMMDLVDSSSGNIAMVFKHVPVHGQSSRTESLASECAAEQGGNPAFYKMARAIFADTRSDGHGLATPLDKLAENNGLDGQRIIECVNAARPSAKIAEDVKEAARLNIQQTPANIVVYGDKSAMVQGSVNGTGLMQMMAQLSQGGDK